MLKGFLFPSLAIVGVGAATIGANISFFSDAKESSQPSAPQVASAEVPQTATAATAATEPKSAKPKLLFFLNPEGRPCQMQDAALNAIRSSIEAIAEIVYISTTNPSDENAFYHYGIRSLPSLIILNSEGSEARRFPPGIQDAQAVLNALKEIK